jgi:hypothetical protein
MDLAKCRFLRSFLAPTTPPLRRQKSSNFSRSLLQMKKTAIFWRTIFVFMGFMFDRNVSKQLGLKYFTV